MNLSSVMLLTGAFLFGTASNVAAADDASALFEQRIRPLFIEHCYKCHSREAKEVKGGLLLDTKEGLLKGGNSGPAIVPGNPDESLLIKAVRYTDDDLRMPPAKGGSGKLSEIQIASLVQWVKIGAPDPRVETAETGKPSPRAAHWAFQTPHFQIPPKVQQAGWPKSPIDHFILAGLEQKKIAPVEQADKRTLIRRATFDLTGLPPTPEEIAAFLEDKSEKAFEKVIDRLLASHAYGEQWGRHWLDVVRYADTAGETADYPVPLAWKYLNYVIESFNKDKPYDQFVREQIAGDILALEGPREEYGEKVIATGYLAISRRFGFDSENYHHLTIEDTIDVLGKSLLGLSTGCARCHDHKYDPITMRDYYGLYGIFESTRFAFPGSEQKQKVRAMVPTVPPEESIPKTQAYAARFAALARKMEEHKLPVPPGILRSLHETDGDFELQTVTGPGTPIIVIPPWRYEGQPAITAAAQSPFQNLHHRGGKGLSLPAGTNRVRVMQQFWPGFRAPGYEQAYLNIDFRTQSAGATNKSPWKIYLGHGDALSAAMEIVLSSESAAFKQNGDVAFALPIKPGEWFNLHLSINLKSRTVSGSLTGKEGSQEITSQPLLSSWDGVLDFISFEPTDDQSRFGLEVDNITLQAAPIPPLAPIANATASGLAAEAAPDPEKLKKEMAALVDEGPCDLAYGVVESTPRNTRIQVRGNPETLGPEVPRAFLAILGGDTLSNQSKGSGRRELAEWITRPENPLFARVMVNRIWQYHFARGLVTTPNDFGVRGTPPTHPELLDFLVHRFIESGWSIKQMHREIMLSQLYQLSSREDSQAAQVDPGNELYWRFNRRRLEAESIRDSILAISGELDRTPGREHPFPPPSTWGFTQHGPFAAVYDHKKRSVYLMTQRLKRHPFLALFDGPDPNASTPLRHPTTVPTQALYFMNDAFVHASAEKFALRLLASGSAESDRIERGFLETVGRPPREEELKEAQDFIKTYSSELVALGTPALDAAKAAYAGYIRVLFGSNEFIHVN